MIIGFWMRAYAPRTHFALINTLFCNGGRSLAAVWNAVIWRDAAEAVDIVAGGFVAVCHNLQWVSVRTAPIGWAMPRQRENKCETHVRFTHLLSTVGLTYISGPVSRIARSWQRKQPYIYMPRIGMNTVQFSGSMHICDRLACGFFFFCERIFCLRGIKFGACIVV